MPEHSIRRVALPTLAALGAGAAVAAAAIPSADGTIHACYDPAGTPSGVLRVIDADSAQCAAGEQALVWNQQGPPGGQGIQGIQGVRGPQGEAGAQGEARPQGDAGGPPPSVPGVEPGAPGATSSPAAGASGPSADIFLRLDGIRGASTARGHKGEIDVRSFAFGVRRAGAGARRARVDALRLTKGYDAASPRLFRAAADGRRFARAVVTFRRSGDAKVDVVTYTLTGVRIATYRHGGKGADGRELGPLEEEIGLSVARVRVTQRTVDDNGKARRAVTASSDLGSGRG